MRVVFVGHSAGMLGAERSMFDIVSGAVGDGHDVAVVLPTTGPLVAALRGVGATVLIHPMRAWMGARHWIPPVGAVRVLQAARTAEGLVTIVRRLQPDVVVTNTSVIPAGAIAARRLTIPHVWIVRESLRDNPQLRSFLRKRWIAREIIRRSAALCTISPYVEEQIDELAATRHPRSFTVSPNPASGAPRTVTEPPPGFARTLLLPGFFSREKGQHLVVLGAFLARRRGELAKVRIVGRGRGPFTLLLKVMIRLLGLQSDVQVLPWADDLGEEYAGAHFVMTASRNEAFGRTVVEAFAHGRPVIGFARGATTMLLSEGGGLAAHPSSAKGMAVAIARASTMSAAEYDDLRQRAVKRGGQFERGPSQYVAFRSVLHDLEQRSLILSR
jgi:glycosyltransferase involved in cell wall biosynthesis